MKEIPLSQGLVTLVDDEDYEWLSGCKWHVFGETWKYAVSHRGPNGTGRTRMHRAIFGNVPKGMIVDHINGNSLDNRRSNLRLCTTAQNMMNSKLMSNNTSGYKGVSFSRGKWVARLRYQGKFIYLGAHDDPKTAHEAYKSKAKELFGEYARFE